MVQHLSRIALFVQLTHHLPLVVKAKSNAPQLLALHHPSSVFSLFPNPQLDYICQRNSTTSSYAFTQPPQTFPPSLHTVVSDPQEPNPRQLHELPKQETQASVAKKENSFWSRKKKGVGKRKTKYWGEQGQKAKKPNIVESVLFAEGWSRDEQPPSCCSLS